MILNHFQSTREKKRKKEKKKNIHTGISSVRLHPLPFFLFLLLLKINMRKYLKKREKEKGAKRKKPRTLLESHVILFLWYLING